MTMAEKIVVMHDGVVEQVGAPLELYDRPQNLFVAGFIGSPAMNLIRGRVVLGGAPSVHADGGIRLPLDRPLGSENQQVVYGIRPEHLSVAEDGIPVEVVVVEPTGSETQVVARLGGQDVIVVLRQRIATRLGETIRLKPDTRFVHLFDEASGRRI